MIWCWQGLSARTERVVPIVLFYNKRDLPDVMPVEYMDATFGLRTWKVPRLSGSALTGSKCAQSSGFDYLKSHATIGRKARLGGKGGSEMTRAAGRPPPVGSGATPRSRDDYD